MQTFLFLFLIFSAYYASGQSLSETPQQALNHYVAFLNQSVNEVTQRFEPVRTYYGDIHARAATGNRAVHLAPSGTLEEYYYNKAIATQGLTDAEKQRLGSGAQALWKLLNQLDETVKALETYDRLKDYQQDNFKRAGELITAFQQQMAQFSRDKDALYKQIQRVYRRYQPYIASDPYLYTEKEMEQTIASQQQLLDTLSYYLDEKGPSNWPVELIQQSILADEKLVKGLGQAKAHIKYPADDMINSFRAGLQSIQTLKRQAVDAYNFNARQSAQHSNKFYAQFINYYNNDLLSWYQQFVNNSATVKNLLSYPKFSPVFAFSVPVVTTANTGQAEPFKDVAPIIFTVKPAAAPVSAVTFQTLSAYVDFINESLRQMARMQILMRDYQSSAEPYRDPARVGRRYALTYSHEEFTVPVSEHQVLTMHNQHIPQPYRASVAGQADVLLAILKEMDALSIELINYTREKRYEQDHLQRSDAILDRYAYLFDTFDQKKERLYQDVRRIYEGYPVKNPVDSWNVAGKALIQLLDADKEILFGVRAYLKGEAAQLPVADALKTQARTVIADEFKNLKGLQRYGRSNGLCPYTPYEDLAEHSIKLSELAQRISPSHSNEHPYESFYYFFNNELSYAYNRFAELAKVPLLKTINEPNVFAFRRSKPTSSPPNSIKQGQLPEDRQLADNKNFNSSKLTVTPSVSSTVNTTPNGTSITHHDTIYVNQRTVDTVYIDRSGPQTVPSSLAGFAANNMVLLLDVSGSMDSPQKLPLLKKSVKSLLTLLRPEDQLSIVVYSGKARVVLKPTSGANPVEIARVIDQLESDGDTDGEEGIRLAYKVANKNYIRAGNNRIILATDGEFPISNEVFQLADENSRQDVYMTVFTFGRNELKSNNLKKLAQSGKGTYTHVTPENANLKLILEAQAKKAQ
jgi:Mg-chelatase subunit ChlD